MIVATWQNCVNSLRNELPTQQFNTWIRPLKAVDGGNQLSLLAPNKFILEWVKDNFLDRIQLLMGENYSEDNKPIVILELASDDRSAGISNTVSSSDLISPFVSESERTDAKNTPANESVSDNIVSVVSADNSRFSLESGRSLTGNPFEIKVRPEKAVQTDRFGKKLAPAKSSRYRGELNSNYTFSNFIEGKSNQLARAASAQVASNPGSAYNPLFIYGGVGLGKTHLMHAIGNHIKHQNPDANVVYLHSQVFVNSMVSALQLNAINEFKRFYHSVDALLIDDIQFFANKERSQEEFFHTFNAIFEGGRQIIMTCDKYYNQINGLEERLKSRFGWGLSVAVEPPELETRAAILINKANHDSVYLSNEAAMFMAQKLRSNVRELEGALKKVVAHSRFVGEEISIPLIKEALKDLLAIQNRLVTIDNIQRTVSEYYKIKMSDMLSKRRSRSVARPRQVAMCLSKELTNHSLPEIGNHYGGRDHTTVLHACRTIHELCKTSVDIHEDYQNLLRILSS